MTSPTTPSGGATLADLEAMPGNDGNRYELIDGHIIVGPWPSHYGGVSFHLGPILAHAVPPATPPTASAASTFPTSSGSTRTSWSPRTRRSAIGASPGRSC